MRFKFYILISLIIHLIIIIFSPNDIKNERLKGEKIIPIEIIQNKSFYSSKGNTNKNSPQNMPQKSQYKKKDLIKKVSKKIQTKPDLNLKDINKNFKGNLQVKRSERKEKNLLKENKKVFIKEKKLSNTKISNPQKKGFSERDNEKGIEKGSLKGKGELKITCLNCISPKYPEKALKKGLEGKLTVKIWILKNGDVEKAEIITSSGITSIDNAALKAALKSKFYPLEYNSFLNIQYDLKLK
mgnify:FL=1|tara:strand:+ start:2042 stop:2764 length:723 start_codon:yes stop_codon:yes gene_type:complete